MPSKSDKQGAEFSRDREFKVILEDLQSQFRLFGEGFQNFSERLERVEIDVAEIKLDVTRIKSAFSRFFSQLSGHETRITILEKR